MAQRLSGPLHAMMSAGLPNSPLQIAGWIILRKHPYGFPCPALHTHCWPLPEKKKWTEWTSGVTLNMEGESFVFIPACSWGMPVSRLCGAAPSHALILPSALHLLQNLYQHRNASSSCPTTEQELPGVLAQHNMLSSQAKPRSLSLPALCHFFLVQ